MSDRMPEKAMVLAAGLGKRMRPITERIPKPLVPIAGKPLIDWGLDALAGAGVGEAVVNVHHLAPQLIAHLEGWPAPRVRISDESQELLESAGGIVKALSMLGTAPFFVLNADTFWVGGDENLAELALAWDSARMDILLMLANLENATGHSGRTDFLLAGDGRLSRAAGAPEGLIYAGAAIVSPAIFEDARAEPHSLNVYFDQAIANGRLFGHVMKGHWITVGTPDAIPAAEAAVARHSAGT
ncbi:MAG: nucleotidyltransferase family protein [Rhizobiaceae bacterium]|nr:nucleotidyltransferase family protein [Rhizobiaceae bacterium]